MNPTRPWLIAVLLLALALRLYVIWTQTYLVYLDEIFQYFEQGHRLAFGSGIRPWEYFDGIRSWLLPGIIAGVMRVTDLFGDNPLLYVRAVKTGFAIVSLTVITIGFGYGLRRDGLRGAVITGLTCAVWFELIYYSGAVLNEVLAAHCALCAVYLGDTRGPRRLMCAGALFGLAAYLRVQYAPAMLVAVLWQHRLAWQRYKWLALGGLAVLLPLGGVLDTLTWGTPFQSVWLNVVRNTMQGVSSSWSTQPWQYYLEFEAEVWQVAIFLGVFAVLGARQAPSLALMAAVVLITHSLVPHKEYRFIYLALAAAPILIGLGMSTVVGWVAARSGMASAQAVMAIMLLLVSGSSGYAVTHGILNARFHWLRADIQVFLAAHHQADLCGLGVRNLPKFATGGYTYLNRDVPLYLWDSASPYRNPGSDIPLRLAVILHRHALAHTLVTRWHATRIATTIWLRHRTAAYPALQSKCATLTRSTPSCRPRSACSGAPARAIEPSRGPYESRHVHQHAVPRGRQRRRARAGTGRAGAPRARQRVCVVAVPASLPDRAAADAADHPADGLPAARGAGHDHRRQHPAAAAAQSGACRGRGGDARRVESAGSSCLGLVLATGLGSSTRSASRCGIARHGSPRASR